MTEAGLKTLIETTLAIPVFEGKDSIIYPGATLEVTNIDPSLFGDGLVKTRVCSAVINLWYIDKSARDSAVNSLMTAMDALNIVAPMIDTYYDTTAKKYRAVFRTQFPLEPDPPATSGNQ